jgi:hypothetical protein
MTNEITTITISPKTRERLEKLKEHPRVANEEILVRLLDFWERYGGLVKKG